MDQEEVGNLFENYNLNSACVVDKNNKLVGMITSDDFCLLISNSGETYELNDILTHAKRFLNIIHSSAFDHFNPLLTNKHRKSRAIIQ